jgi:serine/threonine protein kinase
MIGEQLINILQYIHFKNFIHRDISPSNFLIGRGKKNNKIFLIDYSSARRYRDAKTL